MQRLQQILQRAIGEKCELLDMSAQAAITVLQESGQTSWPDVGTLSEQDILDFQKMLFPKGINGSAARGQIEIPNFGTLLTIGATNPTRLLIFLPAGHALFDAAWNDLSAPLDASPVIPPVPQPFAQPSDAVTPPLPVMKATPDLPPKPSLPTPPLAPTTPAVDSFPLGAALPTDLFGAPRPKKKAAEKEKEKPVPSADMPKFAPPQDLSAALFGGSPQLKKTPATPDPIEVSTAAPKPHEPLPVAAASDQVAIAAFEPLAVRTIDAPAVEDVGLFAPAPTGSVQFGETNMDMLSAKPLTQSAPPRAKVDVPDAPAKLSAMISPGPKDIDKYLKIMLERKASDFHITSGEAAVFRIDGDVERIPEWTWSEQDVSALLDPITSPYSKHQFEADNDADLAYEIPGVARFRVNLFRDRHGRGAVLRHIPSKIPSFEDLGLPEVLKKFCFLNKGLVVVTGPTGSGKSTTLAAMVDYINENRKDHLLTLEDPIEFVHKQKNCLIRQREIFKHTTSFARALKAALREDPDIILVGELRDLETTALAIEIAETGHLVLGTLHTSTAASTIDRIIDQFPADRQEQIRTMLAESLKGVVAQTLLKKAGGGRVAAQEILVVNQAVSAMIREGKIHMLPSHMQSQKAEGNILLNEALTSFVQKKLVTPKDAWLKAVDKGNLIERFRVAGIDMSWLTTISAA